MRRFGGDRSGATVVVTALMLPVLVGGIGLAVEVSSWLQTKRALQNAADSAVVAAATNGGSNYLKEARAVSSRFGFVHDTKGVTVTASNAATCPGGGSTCYSVTVTSNVPLFFTKVLGYAGTVTSGGEKMTGLSATATAKRSTVPREYCILALASSGSEGIRTNGAPKSDLTGCNLMSNTTATCNGHNTKADYGDAASTNNGCGVVQTSNMPVVTDPYSGLASNIPTDTCGGSYPQAPAKKKDDPLPSSNLLSGSYTIYDNKIMCGDVQLTGNVTINATSGGRLVLFNGSLDLNGYTLSTASGSSLTIIFAGTSSSAYDHIPTGGGMIDIQAPTTGTWKGIAIYQAPSLTQGVDISDAGNSPAWKITGMVYLPHSSVTFSGAVNKASNGASCFGMVVDNITVNGTAMIFAQGECDRAGLTLPTNQVAGRGSLVF